MCCVCGDSGSVWIWVGVNLGRCDSWSVWFLVGVSHAVCIFCFLFFRCLCQLRSSVWVKTPGNKTSIYTWAIFLTTALLSPRIIFLAIVSYRTCDIVQLDLNMSDMRFRKWQVTSDKWQREARELAKGPSYKQNPQGTDPWIPLPEPTASMTTGLCCLPFPSPLEARVAAPPISNPHHPLCTLFGALSEHNTRASTIRISHQIMHPCRTQHQIQVAQNGSQRHKTTSTRIAPSPAPPPSTFFPSLASSFTYILRLRPPPPRQSPLFPNH